MLSPPIGFARAGEARWTRRRYRQGRRGWGGSRAQWRGLLERFAASGQSREAFCREQGLIVSSFDRWRRPLEVREDRDKPPFLERPVEDEARLQDDAMAVRRRLAQALTIVRP